jgi:hypothetical protein
VNPKDLVGAKKAPLRYVPPALMLAAARAMENGALKYGPFNWRDQPVEVVTYVEAVLRHLFAFLDGQDLAEDSGLPHIDHAIAGLGIIADARALGTLIDNRYTAGPAADMLRALDQSLPGSAPTLSDEGRRIMAENAILNSRGPLFVDRPSPVTFLPEQFMPDEELNPS